MQLTIHGQPHESNLRLINRLFFAIAVLEGMCILVYLLALLIDPVKRMAYLRSSTYLVVLMVTTASIFLFAFLFWKYVRNLRWQLRFDQLVFRRPTNLPNLLLGIILAFLLGLGIIAFYKPDLLIQLNSDKLKLLWPLIAWSVLLMLQLAVVWFLTWADVTIHISPPMLETAAILVLFVISISARASMTTYGLPYQNVWDEVVTYPQAMRMLVEPGMKPSSDVPGYGKAAYGDFFTYITFAGEVVGLLNGLRTQVVSSVTQFVSPPTGAASIKSAVDPSGIPLQYPRMLLALINSLTPVLIYLILRKSFHFDLWSSFGAGLILAIFSREVIYYSSFILPDALATLLFTGLLLAAFACLDDEKGRLGPYIVCGILTGLVLNVTLRAVAVIVVPFLALFLARNHTRIWAKLALILLGMVAAFIISSPYNLLDFPGYLNKITGLVWLQDMSWKNRISGFLFYFQGMFQPGFTSMYVDSNNGSIGLGPIVAFLGLVGAAKLVRQYPRHSIVMLVFTAVHLYMISTIVERYTRHALVLYPIACIFAGAGLMLLAEGLITLLKNLPTMAPEAARPLMQSKLWWSKAVPVFLLGVFILAALPQINLTIQYIQRMANFQTSQEKVADYLSANLRPGDKVAILNLLPWVEQDLNDHRIPFARFSANATLEELHDKGFTLVVSTDQLSGQYESYNGKLLNSSFSSSKAKLIEFGGLPLMFEGFPAGDLYMFVARVP